MKTTYCLFEGRHDLPENKGALFESFNFEEFKGVRTPLYYECLDTLKKGEKVHLLVTGLTPALTEFLRSYAYATHSKEIGLLILLHFNAKTGQYSQEMW